MDRIILLFWLEYSALAGALLTHAIPKYIYDQHIATKTTTDEVYPCRVGRELPDVPFGNMILQHKIPFNTFKEEGTSILRCSGGIIDEQIQQKHSPPNNVHLFIVRDVRGVVF